MNVQILIYGLGIAVAAAGFVAYIAVTKLRSPVFSVLKLDETMTVYAGGGCNTIVLRAKDGQRAIVIDTKYFRGARELKKLITAPDVTVINTHFHLDHARGNKYYPNAQVISGLTNWRHWDFDTAHSKRPDVVLKPGESIRLEIDNEIIHVIDMGKAHSPNDLVVYFEKRRVLATGDLVWKDMHPVLLDRNTDLELWKTYLRRMKNDLDIEKLVPGHGAVCGKETVLDMIEYFDSISQSLNDTESLNRLKNKYKVYRTFPFFGNFNRTARFLRKSIAK